MVARNFTVKHGGIQLKVTLRDTVREVHQAFQAFNGGMRRRDGRIVHAFFWQTQSAKAKHLGGIVLPMAGGDLRELVPHEVAHAVIAHHGGVLPHDDEAAATAIGMLSARILKRIEQIGAAA